MSRLTSSFTCQHISVIITTLIIHHSFTPGSNLPFSTNPSHLILLTWTAFTITGPDRTYRTSRFIFSLFFFSLIFLFVPCGGPSLLHVSFLLHYKYTVSYRIFVCYELSSWCRGVIQNISSYSWIALNYSKGVWCLNVSSNALHSCTLRCAWRCPSPRPSCALPGVSNLFQPAAITPKRPKRGILLEYAEVCQNNIKQSIRGVLTL